MNQPAGREVTPEMIYGNHLTHECVMAAVFQADVLMSVSLRVFEREEYCEPEASAWPDFPSVPNF